jgi:hypothetical protein
MPAQAAAGLPAALLLPAAGSTPAPSGDGALFEALLGAAVDAKPLPVASEAVPPSAQPPAEGAPPMRLDAGPPPAALPQPVPGEVVEAATPSVDHATPELAARAEATSPEGSIEAVPERPLSPERPSMEWRRSDVEPAPDAPTEDPASEPFRVPTVETAVDDGTRPDPNQPPRSDIGRPRMQMAPTQIQAPVQEGPPRPAPVFVDAQPMQPVEGPVLTPETLDTSAEPAVVVAASIKPRQAPRRAFSTSEPSRIEAAPGSAPLTSEAVDAPEAADMPEALRTFEHNDVEPLPGSVKLRGVRGARVAVDLGNGDVVRGTIDVQDGEVDVQLKASEEAALRAEKRVGELKEALDEKGLKLARFTVDNEEQERRERRQQREQRQRQYNPDDEAPGGFFNRRA